VVINQNTADRLRIQPGARMTLRASCSGEEQALPPMTFTVAGVAQFPFDTPNGITVAASLDQVANACGGNEVNEADVIMAASQETAGPDTAVADVARLFPSLKPLSNVEAVSRFERGGFTYFRQISTVLTTVTLAFAVLLITVLLTVSINQRLGEIAALRALGFSRWRVVADVFCESVLIVGGGGLLSLPLGASLAVGLDHILKRIPGIPADVHFFVYQEARCRCICCCSPPPPWLPRCTRFASSQRCRSPRRSAMRCRVIPVAHASPPPAIVAAAHISRVFPMPAGPVTAVADVTLRIASGDHIAIRGPSGCGKSTLLHMLGCVETPSSGTLLINGHDVTKLSDRDRSRLRLRSIGFVFQRFFLLPMLTAAENVELPQSEANISKAERRGAHA
jgi:hypothetical protein